MRQTRAQKGKQKNRWPWIITSVVAIVIGLSGVFLLTTLNKKETTVLPIEQQTTNNSNSVATQDTSKQNQGSTINTNKEIEDNLPEVKDLPEVEVDADGYAIVQGEVAEPTYIDGVLLANKKYPLPKTYNPGEDPEAKKAMDTLILAAKDAGFSIVAFSSFRSYEYQQGLYDRYVERDGKEKADRYSARPGHSEHQTGLAFDVGEIGREDVWLTSNFGETAAGKWLMQNAHKYGFILRYPKGKEDITGFMYESWHYRYLGEELATKVHASGLTLEEYLGVN